MKFAKFNLERFTDSENFVNIVSRKQKLHLSEVKTAILQLNDLYFRNCCTKMRIKLSVWALLRRGKSKVRRVVLNQQHTAQPDANSVKAKQSK